MSAAKRGVVTIRQAREGAAPAEPCTRQIDAALAPEGRRLARGQSGRRPRAPRRPWIAPALRFAPEGRRKLARGQRAPLLRPAPPLESGKSSSRALEGRRELAQRAAMHPQNAHAGLGVLACLALALPLSGCAGRLGTASAATPPEPTQSTAAAPSPRQTTAARLTLTAEQPLPAWLTDAAKLFVQVTGTSVELPAPSTSDGSAPADAPRAQGDVRWVDAAEARELADEGQLAAVPQELAGALASELTEHSSGAFERSGRHWGVPLAATWLGLIYDAEVMPAGEDRVPPFLEDWIALLRRIRNAGQRDAGPVTAPLWVAWDEPGCADTFALFVTAMGGRLLNDRGLPAFADEGDAGSRALALMQQLRDEGLIPRSAFETHASDLAAALERGHAFWIGWSEILDQELSGDRRRSLLRRLGQLQPAPMPVEKVYSHENHRAVVLVRYRGLVVSANSRDPEAAWRLVRFLSHPLLLDSSSQLTAVTRGALPPSGRFASQSRARLTGERLLARWELTPEGRETLGWFIQAALKKRLPREEALERAARALGAPAPATAPAGGGGGFGPPSLSPTAPGVPPSPATGQSAPSTVPGSTTGAPPAPTGTPAEPAAAGSPPQGGPGAPVTPGPTAPPGTP